MLKRWWSGGRDEEFVVVDLPEPLACEVRALMLADHKVAAVPS